MPLQIDIDRDALAEFCRRHHITRLSLFGSVSPPGMDTMPWEI